jgi:hypothetical protein
MLNKQLQIRFALEAAMIDLSVVQQGYEGT